MAPLKKSSRKPTLACMQPVTTVNARLSEALVNSAKSLASSANQTLTEFIKKSVEHEISRRTLCKPQNVVTLLDVKIQLDQLNEQLAGSKARDRLQIALLESIAQTLDLDT